MCQVPENKRVKLTVEPEATTEITTMLKSKMMIGAHVSAAKGVYNAFKNCKAINGKAFALFLKSQRKWENPPLSENDAKLFHQMYQDSGLSENAILPHGSYLINLGNPDVEKRAKSFESFLDDILRCEKLGIKLYNLHPGSTVGECAISNSIKFIADNINEAISKTQSIIIVLETMAGQGNTIGSKFEELKEIIDKVKDKSRIGVCIDTCHIFAAGYDIRTKDSYEKTMSKFETLIGFKYLKGVHLNDSKEPFNSGKDRHENIGKGKIGLDAFRYIMNDMRFANIPMVLETPVDPKSDDNSIYKEEIQLLYSLIEEC